MGSKVLLYDADCEFCTTTALWLAKRNTFELQGWQYIDDLEALGLDYEMVTTASHWMEDGRVVAAGSDAIGRALIARGGIARILGHITVSPLTRPIARQVYKRIANNRHRMPTRRFATAFLIALLLVLVLVPAVLLVPRALWATRRCGTSAALR